MPLYRHFALGVEGDFDEGVAVADRRQDAGLGIAQLKFQAGVVLPRPEGGGEMQLLAALGEKPVLSAGIEALQALDLPLYILLPNRSGRGCADSRRR